jgi:putative CRISPR-associated protein (TIGR02619 family)
MKQAQTLICTVGTSLFFPNLQGLRTDDAERNRGALAEAYATQGWVAVADGLAACASTDRLCGAEINSLASLFAQGYADPKADLYFVHSATADGRAIGQVLSRYFQLAGHPLVEVREVDDLQDSDPRRFRTKGLRNLAKVVCKIIRDDGPESCAINATGGYKAQIAIAVLMGQALGVPVYYKHERFDDIIPFPPMPVALNYEVWLRMSGLLFALERDGKRPSCDFDEVFREGEVAESLIERTVIDGTEYLELSPAGQIFHDTFRERFRTRRDEILTLAIPANQRRSPRLEQSGDSTG